MEPKLGELAAVCAAQTYLKIKMDAAKLASVATTSTFEVEEIAQQEDLKRAEETTLINLASLLPIIVSLVSSPVFSTKYIFILEAIEGSS